MAWTLTVVYFAAALAVMCIAPRVPYADGWRFLGRFASTPALEAIFYPDNGHYEILPNALRVLELHVTHASQALQVGAAIVLLLTVLACLWALIRGQASRVARATTMLAATVGVCWLGNVRVLGHANESVHALLVIACVVAGIGMLTHRDARPGAGAGTMAALAGLLATFSFGTGIAAFVAFAVIMVLRRARKSAYLTLGLGLAFALLLRQSGDDAARPGIAFAPLEQLDLSLRWLSGPWIYSVWPVVDPQVAARIPVEALRGPMLAIAQTWAGLFGPALISRWPQLLVGVIGMAWLALASTRAWRGASRAELLGIGLAWFAVAAGGLIAIVRMQYFQQLPEQLLASRYVVWSSIFWAGLAIATIARASSPGRALWATLAVAVFLLPSQVWMWRLGQSLRAAADRTAVAAAVGVLAPELKTGETPKAELAAALPPIRAAGAAVFAWPETKQLGAEVDARSVQWVPHQALAITHVDNLLGGKGRGVCFQAQADAPRLLLIDADGVTRGIASHDAEAGQWCGWMRCTHAGDMRVARWR